MDSELLLRFTKIYNPIILQDYLTAFRAYEGSMSRQFAIIGRKEADTYRKKIIKNRDLLKLYRKNSANKWLFFSKNRHFSIIERMQCLINCIKLQPSRITKISFWSSLKAIILKENK